MILIRPVNPQEAVELTKIALAAKRHWGYPEHWIEIWTPQLTYNAEYFEKNESWTAIVDIRPVAFYTLLDKDGIAWIENLWVMPEYISKGVGKRLFLHAVEIARQRKYKTLQLEADPNALGFYEKLGMHKIGEHQSEVDEQPRVLPLMEMNL
jgi:ribosomal protein S18 acetylase RimI-like enzyme